MNTDPFRDALVQAHGELREYMRKLVADLSDAEMVTQPVAGRAMNHAAWVLAHLSIYGPIVSAILRGEPFQDTRDHPYGGLSKPLPDASAYPSKAELLRANEAGYDLAVQALRSASPDRLAAPVPLDRWKDRFPTAAHFAQHILVKHMAVHLGQLSAWRRAGGRPSV